jgi:hypothetical protein
MSKKVCAYCKKEKKLTKEHIWPASIVRKLNDRARYSSTFKKLVTSDLVIKDVCADCNGGPLSIIDAYGLKLFDKYFEKDIDIKQTIKFEYDFKLLSRWLLKLSFNSARASKSDYLRLEKYAPMLIDLELELPNDFSITLDIVEPTIINSKKTFKPNTNRICSIQFPKDIGDWCTVRLVTINSFYFWILIQDVPDNEVNIEHAEKVLSQIKGTYIDKQENIINISPNGTDALEMHKNWAHTLNENNVELNLAKHRRQ